MKTVIFLSWFVTSLIWVPFSEAEDNTCWLKAPPQEDVWVIVYDADADGNRGDIIWQGKIPAGQEIKVESTDGLIRYDSKTEINQPYDGDISLGCFGQQSFYVE